MTYETAARERQLSEARRLNRMIEREWQERLDAGLKPATRAEDAWRQNLSRE